jgi:hypothetical protein
LLNRLRVAEGARLQVVTLLRSSPILGQLRSPFRHGVCLFGCFVLKIIERSLAGVLAFASALMLGPHPNVQRILASAVAFRGAFHRTLDGDCRITTRLGGFPRHLLSCDE